MSWLARRLSRETSSQAFVPEIDGLRFIAIAAVFVHHVTGTYLRVSERLGPVLLPQEWWSVKARSTSVALGFAGHFGVHVFFVISGIVMALPFAESYRRGTPRQDLRSYLLRRIVRLEPPYILAMLVALAVIVCTQEQWRGPASHLAPSLAYLHGALFGRSSPINYGIAWSLEVEVQFYLLMPLLGLVFAIDSAIVRRSILLVSTLVTAWLAQEYITRATHPRLALSLVNFIQFFLAGLLFADFYEAWRHSALRRRLAWDAVALLTSGFILWILTRERDLFALTPVLVIVLFASLLQGRFGRPLIRNPWLVTIGGMCYSIYLYHYIVIELVTPHTVAWVSTMRMSVALTLQALALAIPVGVVSILAFVGIEKPCMQLARRVAGRRRAGTALERR